MKFTRTDDSYDEKAHHKLIVEKFAKAFQDLRRESLAQEKRENGMLRVSDVLFSRFAAGYEGSDSLKTIDDDESNTKKEYPTADERPTSSTAGFERDLKRIFYRHKDRSEQQKALSALVNEPGTRRRFDAWLDSQVNILAKRFMRKGVDYHNAEGAAVSAVEDFLVKGKWESLVKNYDPNRPLIDQASAMMTMQGKGALTNHYKENSDRPQSLDAEIGGRKDESSSTVGEAYGPKTTDIYNTGKEEDPELNTINEKIEELQEDVRDDPRKQIFLDRAIKYKNVYLSRKQKNEQEVNQRKDGLMGGLTGRVPGTEPPPANEPSAPAPAVDNRPSWQKALDEGLGNKPAPAPKADPLSPRQIKKTKFETYDTEDIDDLMSVRNDGNDELINIIQDIAHNPVNGYTGAGQSMIQLPSLLRGDIGEIPNDKSDGKKATMSVPDEIKQAVSTFLLNDFLNFYKKYVLMRTAREKIDEDTVTNLPESKVWPMYQQQAAKSIENSSLPDHIKQIAVKQVMGKSFGALKDWRQKADPWLQQAIIEKERRRISKKNQEDLAAEGVDPARIGELSHDQLTDEHHDQIADTVMNSLYTGNNTMHGIVHGMQNDVMPMRTDLSPERKKQLLVQSLQKMRSGSRKGLQYPSLDRDSPDWSSRQVKFKGVPKVQPQQSEPVAPEENENGVTASIRPDGLRFHVGPTHPDAPDVTEFIRENIKKSSGLNKLVAYASELEEIKEYDFADMIDSAISGLVK